MADIHTDPFTGAQYFVPGIGYTWYDRNGTQHSVMCPNDGPEDAERALELAMRSGYPGHRGDGWSYFKEDVRALWRKLWRR